MLRERQLKACKDLFIVCTATPNSQEDLFVSFQGNAVIFGGFQSVLPGESSTPGAYFGGLGPE